MEVPILKQGEFLIATIQAALSDADLEHLRLALVQRVVQAHQGTVSVDSAVGRGTTFRVELPVARGPG